MRPDLPISKAPSLEYESQSIAFAVSATPREPQTVEMLAGLVVTFSCVGLCSLSWWMALNS